MAVAATPPSLPVPADRFPAVTPPPAAGLSLSTFSPNRGDHAPTATMPRPGDTFCGFRLVEELGHGTFARVFLAKQEALAGRDVALKVTLKPNREPERLARLQHTNVVPVYSVHTAPPVQLICMPYLGRRTVADALTGYRQSCAAAGLSTRKALGTRKNSTAVAGSRPAPGLREPVFAPRPVAPAPTTAPLVGEVPVVLRLLAELADGLAHAHARGILHLDLKPANVLLADTGEPMLLDFNLSFDATEANREVVGGTIPYMAPEQLIDLRTRGKGQLDERTDLYSLGVMAFEMLTGEHPFPVSSRTLAEFNGLIAAREKGPPSLVELNPEITPAVEAIVRKLLAPAPADRYQSAADLKEDLDRQLTDRPLKFARDRSIPERLAKWRRRNPRALVAMLLAAAIGLAGGAGALAYTQSEKVAARDAEARVARTRKALDVTRLDLVLPGDAKTRARGMARALEMLREYGLPEDANWHRGEAFRAIPDAEKPAAAADLGELLLLVAHARWADGKDADRAGAAADALQLNKLAEGCFAEGAAPPLLSRQRAELEAAATGGPAAPPKLVPAATARDHFLDGVALLAEGKFKTASDALKRAVTADPDHGAAQFLLGYCKHERGLYTEAVERYEVAQALLPTDPRPAFQRGKAFGQHFKPAPAEEAFTEAINIDPQEGTYYHYRGRARFELGQYQDAERDFTAALAHGTSPLQVYALRAVARDRLHDAAGAAADRTALAACRPETEQDYLVRGYTRFTSDPRGALADYAMAAKINPGSLIALRNQTHLLSDRLRNDKEALRVASVAVDQFPDSAFARVLKAQCLARLGMREEAHREAERCRQLTDDDVVTYRIACVYALTSRTHPEDRKQAFALLKKAIRSGHLDVRAYETDRDLAPIRDLPEFAPLLRAVKELVL